MKTKLFFVIFVLFYFTNAYAEKTYVRGAILHFFAAPKSDANYEFIPDGLLVSENGKIVLAKAWEDYKDKLPAEAKVTHYKQGLILPGFIDTHIHYPQLDMIAANGGGHLIQWLQKYTFPFEQKFQDKAYAEDVAKFFVSELLRNGTTTALVFATIYPQAVDALFEAAEEKNMRLISGKTMGDRNLPEHLQEAPEDIYAQTAALIKKWHKKPNTRLEYAITLRFAPTTTPALFELIKKLKQTYPDTYVHTHISENLEEVNWSKSLFSSKSYLAIYDKYHLLGHKTLLAHGVHLTDAEFKRIRQTRTNVAFCPTSNFFLGSGLYDLIKANRYNVVTGLGTDVGAGTSFSMLQTLNEAYKVLQLQNHNLSSLEGFYLATLGSAKALALEDKLGNFLPGKEADFVVLDLAGATPLLKRRMTFADTLEDKLFVLMTLGDDRSVLATYVNGEPVYQRAHAGAVAEDNV